MFLSHMSQNRIEEFAEFHGVSEERYEELVDIVNDYGWRKRRYEDDEWTHEPIRAEHLVEVSDPEFVYEDEDTTASIFIYVDGHYSGSGEGIPEDEDVFVALNAAVWPEVIQAGTAADAFREMMEQRDKYVDIDPTQSSEGRVDIGAATITRQSLDEGDDILDHFFGEIEEAVRYDRETAEFEEDARS